MTPAGDVSGLAASVSFDNEPEAGYGGVSLFLSWISKHVFAFQRQLEAVRDASHI